MNRLQFLISFLCAGILFGCASTDQPKPSWAKNYEVSEDVFLIRVDAGLFGPRLALVPVSHSMRGSGFYSSPSTIDAPIVVESGFDNVVVGVVKSGTKVRFLGTKREKFHSRGGKIVTDEMLYGEIKSGLFIGKVVDLNDVLYWPRKCLRPI